MSFNAAKRSPAAGERGTAIRFPAIAGVTVLHASGTATDASAPEAPQAKDAAPGRSRLSPNAARHRTGRAAGRNAKQRASFAKSAIAMTHSFSMRPVLYVALLTASWQFSGCNRGDGLERAPITGLLTVQGQPLPGALVQFIPSEGTPGQGAIGISDEQGKFTVISSRQQDEGVPPGEYSVRVSRLMNPDGSFVPPHAPEADFPDSRESIPPPYSSVASPLKVVISPDGGHVPVDIPEPLVGSGKK